MSKKEDRVSELLKHIKSNLKDLPEQLRDIPFVSNIKIRRPKLERFGVWYFRKRLKKKGDASEHAVQVHLLSITERKALKRIQSWAIAKSAIAGAISAAIAAWVSSSYYWMVDPTTHTVT